MHWHDADPDALPAEQERRRARIWADLAARYPKKVAGWRKLCAVAAANVADREFLKSENFRQVGVVRRFVQRAAALNNVSPDDLFYLELNELLAFLGGDQSALSVCGARRETFQRHAELPSLPNLILGRLDPFTWAEDPRRRTDNYPADLAPPEEEVGILKGFPGATGLVEGTVRVLTSHHGMGEFRQGEILVTSFTNVGWTPLFPRAAAIITDIGAPLSHAAIVARELGIPAVVGTGPVTMKLKTGDRVKVHGTRGLVELLS